MHGTSRDAELQSFPASMILGIRGPGRRSTPRRCATSASLLQTDRGVAAGRDLQPRRPKLGRPFRSRSRSRPWRPSPQAQLLLLEVDPLSRQADPPLQRLFERVLRRRSLPEPPSDESMPFIPRSPYATAKSTAHWLTANYREAYGIFACSRHPLQSRVSAAAGAVRDREKSSDAAAAIAAGKKVRLALGDLKVARDWGYAPDSSKRCGACCSRTIRTTS